MRRQSLILIRAATDHNPRHTNALEKSVNSLYAGCLLLGLNLIQGIQQGHEAMTLEPGDTLRFAHIIPRSQFLHYPIIEFTVLVLPGGEIQNNRDRLSKITLNTFDEFIR